MNRGRRNPPYYARAVRAGTLIAAGGLLIALAAGDAEETRRGNPEPSARAHDRSRTRRSPRCGSPRGRRHRSGRCCGPGQSRGAGDGTRDRRALGSRRGTGRGRRRDLRHCPERARPGRTCRLFAPGALRLSSFRCAGVGASPLSGPRSGAASRRRPGVEAHQDRRDERRLGRGRRGAGYRDRDPSVPRPQAALDRRGRDLPRAEGTRWLLAKPSATFYRAVGYADPPLRALTPP